MAVTLITGGAGGIGVALGRHLAQQGHTPVLADRDLDAARAAAEQIDGADALAFDVADAAACERGVQELVARHGRIDGLACCAGILLDFLPPAEYPFELFARTLAVNLHGSFFTAQAAARAMIAGGEGGAIVLVSSGMSERVVSFADEDGQVLANPAYGASKAAVEHVTRELSVAWAPHGIRVNCVSPGMFETEMSRGARETPEFLERYQQHTSLRRHGQPHELAAVMAFLLSDAASYMTAAIVPVDGGYLAI